VAVESLVAQQVMCKTAYTCRDAYSASVHLSIDVRGDQQGGVGAGPTMSR
jgi:hypothetical protein